MPNYQNAPSQAMQQMQQQGQSMNRQMMQPLPAMAPRPQMMPSMQQQGQMMNQQQMPPNMGQGMPQQQMGMQQGSMPPQFQGGSFPAGVMQGMAGAFSGMQQPPQNGYGMQQGQGMQPPQQQRQMAPLQNGNQQNYANAATGAGSPGNFSNPDMPGRFGQNAQQQDSGYQSRGRRKSVGILSAPPTPRGQ